MIGNYGPSMAVVRCAMGGNPRAPPAALLIFWAAAGDASICQIRARYNANVGTITGMEGTTATITGLPGQTAGPTPPGPSS
jgi:hypothetical protein